MEKHLCVIPADLTEKNYNTSNKILIRTEGSVAQGLGHLYRSLSLAGQLTKQGMNVSFWVKKGLPGLAVLTQSSYSCCMVSENIGHDLEQARPDMVLSDLPPDMDRSSLSVELRQKRIFHAAIDDFGLACVDADLCISPSIVPVEAALKQYVSGADYIILNSSFTKRPRKKRILKKQVRTVLVSMGGSDPNNIAPNVLSALNHTPEIQKVIVVVGPLSKKPIITSNSSKEIKVVNSSDQIADYMDEADVGIFSGGVTLYEACFSGLPTMVITQNRYQERTAQELHKVGATCNIGLFSESTEKDIQQSFENFAAHRTEREKMSHTAAGIVDGDGVIRVVALIKKRYKEFCHD